MYILKLIYILIYVPIVVSIPILWILLDWFLFVQVYISL